MNDKKETRTIPGIVREAREESVKSLGIKDEGKSDRVLEPYPYPSEKKQNKQGE